MTWSVVLTRINIGEFSEVLVRWVMELQYVVLIVTVRNLHKFWEILC